MKTGYLVVFLLVIPQFVNAATPPLSKPDLARLRSPSPAPAPPPAWYLTGNFGTLPGTNFIGTRDNQALELKVNAQRVLRLEPNDRGNANILGGSPLNQIRPGVHGSVIAGGGGWLTCEQSEFMHCETPRLFERPQIIEGDFCFIGGGSGNRLAGLHGVIGGGLNNSIQIQAIRGSPYGSWYSAILGGAGNSLTNCFACSIGGGGDNRMGGYSDVYSSVISGGVYNRILYGNGATIAGGYNNYMFGQFCSIGGGYANSIELPTGRDVDPPEDAGSIVFSTIPGGFFNTVRANYSFVAGSLARAKHHGVFLWADASDLDYFSDRRFTSIRNNEFAARATGGFRFVTGNGTGAELPAGGGSWASQCDKNSKENFCPVNPREILQKVAALPLQTWNYKSQSTDVRHLGPTAQDFNAAFGLGEDEKHITNVDADGVSLAAIQGLHQMLAEKDTEIQQLKKSLWDLQKQLSSIAEKVSRSAPASP